MRKIQCIVIDSYAYERFPLFSQVGSLRREVKTEISPYSKPQSYFEVSPSTLLIARELALQFADARQDLEHLNLTHAATGQTTISAYGKLNRKGNCSNKNTVEIDVFVKNV